MTPPATAIVRTDPAWWSENEAHGRGPDGFLERAVEEILEVYGYPPHVAPALRQEPVLVRSAQDAYRAARARVRRGAPPPRTVRVEFIPRNGGGNGHR